MTILGDHMSKGTILYAITSMGGPEARRHIWGRVAPILIGSREGHRLVGLRNGREHVLYEASPGQRVATTAGWHEVELAVCLAPKRWLIRVGEVDEGDREIATGCPDWFLPPEKCWWTLYEGPWTAGRTRYSGPWG